jgi:hypothetical protein
MSFSSSIGPRYPFRLYAMNKEHISIPIFLEILPFHFLEDIQYCENKHHSIYLNICAFSYTF